MFPQILNDLARVEHANRIADVERELRRRRLARRRPGWHAFWRPPSRRTSHALAA